MLGRALFLRRIPGQRADEYEHGAMLESYRQKNIYALAGSL